MENYSELIKKILITINDKSNSKPDSVFIKGYDYEIVFQQLISLYNDGYINADTQTDETGDVVQIFPRNLTSKGIKYLQEL